MPWGTGSSTPAITFGCAPTPTSHSLSEAQRTSPVRCSSTMRKHAPASHAEGGAQQHTARRDCIGGHGCKVEQPVRTIQRGRRHMDVLYKYVSAARALTCIPEVGDGALRATQPAALNDPFECAVMAVYVIPDEAVENRELADVLTEINKSKPVTEEDVHRARQEHGSLFTRQLFTKQVSTRFGIISFATDPFHPLMWSHYTTDGSGFVIGYDASELRRIAGPDCLRPVTYQEHLPLITGPVVLVSPESNLSVSLSIKSDYWSYENEWRLIIELNRTVGTGATDQHDQPINLVQIPNQAVVSVHYTERTSLEEVEVIGERLADVNNRYRAGHPRKLVLSSTSYGYVEAPDDYSPSSRVLKKA